MSTDPRWTAETAAALRRELGSRCAADAAIRHSPGSGRLPASQDPDLLVVATAGGDPDVYVSELLPSAIAAAEARGRQQAIDALRDQGALLKWWLRPGSRTEDTFLDTDLVPWLADYLESISTPPTTETTDG